MLVMGCDFHPGWQQVCWVDTITGETEEKKLVHGSGEAERFYRQLSGPALIGMESTGNHQWFLEMVAAAGQELWVGDAAKIRASDVRQQKHDRRDAALLLKLLLDGRFPRIWVPSSEQKDLRQLLIHRYKLVRVRAQVKNELQHLALNQGVQRKQRLWSAAGQKVLNELALRPWGSRRREDLLKLLAMLDQQVAPLDLAVAQAAQENSQAKLLLSQPGVGPVTSLAFVLTMGDVSRFDNAFVLIEGHPAHQSLSPAERMRGQRQSASYLLPFSCTGHVRVKERSYFSNILDLASGCRQPERRALTGT